MKNHSLLRELRNYIRLLILENEFSFEENKGYGALMDFNKYQNIDDQIKLFNLIWDSLRTGGSGNSLETNIRGFLLKNNKKIIDASKNDASAYDMILEILEKTGFTRSVESIISVAINSIKMFKKSISNNRIKLKPAKMEENQNFLENFDEIMDFWENKVESDQLYMSKFSEYFLKSMNDVARVIPGMQEALPAYRNYLAANMIIHNN